MSASSSSFNNVLIHELHEDGLVRERPANVNDLLLTESNDFRGWECWAGVQNITIDANGDVWRAICRQGEKLGDIYNGFSVAEDTVVCAKRRCTCAADLHLSKAKRHFREKLRVGR